MEKQYVNIWENSTTVFNRDFVIGQTKFLSLFFKTLKKNPLGLIQFLHMISNSEADLLGLPTKRNCSITRGLLPLVKSA